MNERDRKSEKESEGERVGATKSEFDQKFRECAKKEPGNCIDNAML